MSNIENKLNNMGIVLPETNPPAANYLPFKKSGNNIFIAGQTCRWNGEMQFTGRLGEDLTVEEGIKAARLCGLNILLQAKQACDGNLDLIKSCVKLTVFVKCTEEFQQQAKVGNGVSDLMVDVFGDSGRHVRAAVGTNALPSGSAVEVDAIFEI